MEKQQNKGKVQRKVARCRWLKRKPLTYKQLRRQNQKQKQKKHITLQNKIWTVIIMLIFLLSISFSCGEAYALAEENSIATSTVATMELWAYEDSRLLAEDPQAYREHMRQQAIAKEECYKNWQLICQKIRANIIGIL